LVPARGLKGLVSLDSAEALVIAPWPGDLEHLRDTQAEGQIEVVQETVKAIRDIRSRYNIPPSGKLSASASAPQAVARMLSDNSDLICQLAGLSRFEAAQNAPKPNNAAAAIVGETQVYLHDVIDPDAERTRLQKQKQEVETAKKAVEAKLANENFVARAKAEVVAQAREKLQQLQEQLQAIERHLAELGG